ncbi:MAG: BrnT family toxin [Wenzhouxiangella sp.]
MEGLKFSWDARKAAANLTKHRVSFEEAKTVFFDEHARLIPDPEHSEVEDRFILLGYSVRLRLLVVCHSYREREERIRIISARKATKPEQRQYESLHHEN